jgi:CHAT domain-containing protein
LTAGEIQRHLLDPETILLEIHLGPRRSVLWAVTIDAVESHELPPRAVIEKAARRAHELLGVSHLREYRAASSHALSELSRIVLGPVADRLVEQETARLLISGAGALKLVPFAALPVPGDGDPEPLVARHEIVSVPSASALAVLRGQAAGRPRPPGTVAVLADPVFERTDPRFEGSGGSDAPAIDASAPGARDAGDPAVPAGHLRRLRYSSAEAEAILRFAGNGRSHRALGFEATREAAASPALGGYRIVHFATHGALDDEHPELSHLVFSRFDAAGHPRDGVLFAHQIDDLELPVDLVVLSACETALGKEVRGEGLVGLTQGFFHAGAQRVLVSLWQVDDRATAELMARFYEGLLAEGLPAPAALRRAQLAVRGEVGWRAPYYWAGFVLQGDWR